MEHINFSYQGARWRGGWRFYSVWLSGRTASSRPCRTWTFSLWVSPRCVSSSAYREHPNDYACSLTMKIAFTIRTKVGLKIWMLACCSLQWAVNDFGTISILATSVLMAIISVISDRYVTWLKSISMVLLVVSTIFYAWFLSICVWRLDYSSGNSSIR